MVWAPSKRLGSSSCAVQGGPAELAIANSDNTKRRGCPHCWLCFRSWFSHPKALPPGQVASSATPCTGQSGECRNDGVVPGYPPLTRTEPWRASVLPVPVKPSGCNVAPTGRAGQGPCTEAPTGQRMVTECSLYARNFAGTFFAWSFYTLVRTGLSDVGSVIPVHRGRTQAHVFNNFPEATHFASSRAGHKPSPAACQYLSQRTTRRLLGTGWQKASSIPVPATHVPMTHPLSRGFPLLSPRGHPQRSSPSILCPSPRTGQGPVPKTVEAGQLPQVPR